MSAVRVRPARADDVGAICDLYARAFGRALMPREWRWKYAAHLAASEDGGMPTVWVAVDGGDRPISHYGGVPRSLKLGGDRSTIAMVASDVMVAPRLRRRGIYTRTLEVAHETWRQAGIACVLGLPNEQAGSRIEALDWRLLFPLRWRFRPLVPEALLARRLRWPWLGRRRWLGHLLNRLADRALAGAEALRVDIVDPADSWLGRPDPTPETGAVGLLYDRSWTHWRYLTCAIHAYEVLVAEEDGTERGILAWRLDRSGPLPFGLVAEWRATEDRARRGLLWAALVSMRRAGAVAAGILAVPERPEDRLLRRAGFWFSWGAFDVRCVPLADNLPLDLLRDRARFTVAGGDFDVV